MTIPPSYESAFYQSGRIEDPLSNFVRIGADSGRFMPFLHDNLVTKHVFSCIAVVAVNDQTGHMGLWHLFVGEGKDQVRSELLPALEEWFLPESTDIYLIGGREDWSERLAGALGDLLPQAGFSIVDTALFGFDLISFDIAVSKAGEIHVADHKTHAYLMHKPVGLKKLIHYKNDLPAEPPHGVLHLCRRAPVLLAVYSS